MIYSMYRLRQAVQKFVTFVALTSLLAQSLSPYIYMLPRVAYAQEATPTPTDSPTPTDTITPTPTDTVTPTPTDAVAPTESPIPTDVPQETVTPVPTEEPTVAPTEQVNNNSPPSEQSSTPTITETPTPTAEVSPTTSSSQNEENGDLSVVVLENTSAPSIDLESYEAQGSASLTTDKPDYAPTDTALITGTGLLPNTTYILRVWSDDEPATSTEVSVASDENGVFAYAYQLDGTYRPNYSVELKDSTGAVVATITFTDTPPQADLDQYGNDAPAGWQNGNLNANQATYFEGDSVPYRLKFDNLNTAVNHTVIIEWDTTKSSKHALDYLTTYNRTQSADPCAGVSGCGSPTTFAIPTDAQVTGAGVTQIAGNFTLYNGTIASVSAYSYPNGTGFTGDKTARISITFSTTVADPVLAWGGHIAHRSDWGQDNSAIAISGSPYHMRLIDLDGSGGNQDRSLSADAVIFPASITIVKQASPEGSTSFPFTASPSPLSNFNLVDDGTSSNTQVFSGITAFTSQQGSPLYIVTENTPAGWSLNDLSCSVTSANGGTQTVNGSTATINLQEGENVTCTYTNTAQTGTIELQKVWSGTAGQTTLNIGTTAGASDVDSQLTGANGSAPLTTGTNTVNAGTYYVSETGGLTDYTSSLACTKNGQAYAPGASNSVTIALNDVVICTFTNTRNTGSVKVNKLVDSDGNGTFEGGNTEANGLGFTWSLDTVGTNAMGSTVSGVNTGSHSVNESSVTDYHFVGWYLTSDTSRTCSNTTNTTLPAGITVSSNQTTEITLCNAINTGTVVVHKDVQGPNGEALTDTSNNFTIQLDSANDGTITDNGTVTYSNVVVGSHTVTESVVATGYTLYGISETQGAAGNTGGLSVNVASGQTTHVYVTNRQQTGTVTVVKDVLDPDGGAVSDTHPFTTNLNPGAQTDSFAEGDNAVFTVNPGTYTVTENDDPNYDEQGCKLVTGADATNFSVAPGGQVTVTCTNKQKKATIDVIKDVLSPTGGAVSDNHAFTAQLNGGNDQSFSEATSASYLVNPGNHSITEVSDNNYDYVSCTPDANQTPGDGAQVTVGSNGSITITCTNKQKNAQVTVVKDVRDPNGNDVTDNTNFVVQRDGSGTDDKDFRENLNAVYTLIPGTYTFAELVTAGYTLNSINPDNDADVNNGTTVTLNSGQNVTITFTNYQNAGSISGQKLGDTDGVLGTTDDQSNLTNWVIELYTCTSSFTGCVLSATDTTDGNGYSFLNLVPGFYQVREVLQSGWTALTSLFHNVTVSPGEDEQNVNFVNFENVSVTACKKIDADGDISTTGDQTDKSGWEVTLLVDGQASEPAQLTGRDGCYTWGDLGPGHTYGVSEATPSGWTNLTDTTHSFGSATGGSEYIFTFVNFENVSIFGHKWNDLNRDGVWDQGEPALEGWEINLTGASSGSATTDANGEYSFPNLGPGTYTLSETAQDGWTQTYPTNPNTHSVTVASGQNVTDKDFGNQGRGSITVHKQIDVNGDGNYTDGDDGDFTWTLDESGENVMGDMVSDIPAGQHSVGENGVADYHFVGWFPTEEDFSCTDLPENEENFSLPINVEVEPNGASDFTICNARDKGTITVDKVTDPTEDQTVFDINLTDGETIVHTSSLSDTDNPDTYEVLSGTYELSEETVTDWDLTDAICTLNNEGNEFDPRDGTFEVNNEDVISCTFTNTKRGKIIVTKYNDVKGNGELDEEDEVLSGWTINLTDQTSQDTNSDGQVTFDGLVPEEYILGEDLKTGWEQTNIFCPEADTSPQENPNELGVFVGAGQTVECSILNHSTTPILIITKQNNTGGATLLPGAEVLYTITVSLDEEGGAAEDVTVTDLLPDGFKYKNGSWTASSNVNSGLVVLEPTYASPGVWSLGNMTPGETITLTLIATISNDQQLGLYKDVAWGQGKSLAGDTVLAIANDPGDLDPAESNFVGTEVNIDKGTTESVGLSVRRGEVLGASTELPATGAKTLWTLAGVATLLLGLNLMVIGFIIRKRYV